MLLGCPLSCRRSWGAWSFSPNLLEGGIHLLGLRPACPCCDQAAFGGGGWPDSHLGLPSVSNSFFSLCCPRGCQGWLRFPQSC